MNYLYQGGRKVNKKIVSLLIMIAFIAGVTSSAFCADNVQKISAFLNYELKIKLDGNNFTPVDSNGSVMYPIVYNDRSYLPVRAIAEALNIAVDYDAKTKTIYLGERNKTVVNKEVFMNMWSSQYSVSQNELMANNVSYDYGIVFNGNNEYAEFSFFIYPDAKHQKFGGTMCFEELDNSTDEVIIKIRENDHNGKVLKEFNVSKGDSIDFELDIANVKTLYIQNLVNDRVPKNTCPDKLLLAEPYFK